MTRQTVIMVLLAVLVLVAFYQRQDWLFDGEPAHQVYSVDQMQEAFEERLSSIQVKGQGTVQAILKDDREGSRHQRFILELPSGQTVLVAHNIDLAPRIDILRLGDTVEFYGVYEWNDQGGVIHWTHHDPQGKHPDGWLRHNRRLYR